MKHGMLTFGFAAGVLFLGNVAAAQDFAEKGTLSFSADRLFGFVHNSASVKVSDAPDETEVTLSTNSFGLLFNADTEFDIGAYNYYAPTAGYSTPRFAIDYFPIDGLSIGGAVGFTTTSYTVERDATPNFPRIKTEVSASEIVFAPRIGYCFMFSRHVGLWPRGGVHFAHYWADNNDNNASLTANFFAFTFEAPLVLSPTPGFAFLLGPALDFGVAGSATSNPDRGQSTDYDMRHWDIGFQAAILGYI